MKAGKRDELAAVNRDEVLDTRRLVLGVARSEFALKGLAGARVDEIADKAGVNKQAIYYHFGNKDDLFRATLDSCYEDIRAQNNAYAAAATITPPREAVRRLIEHMFDRIEKHSAVVQLIMDENRYMGRHLTNTKLISSSDDPLIDHLRAVFKAGEATGKIAPGIDVEQFFMDIIALCIFYFSNIHTVSAVMDRDLAAPRAVRARRRHIVHGLMASLSPAASTDGD
jgi:TetR/AcrR family transcriptional regulator